ncbi:Os05g0355133 [Oryza sativa Japonica Group]|uniref:Os05g0355133 protein n=1 Tax=Oryza sativa subsp. japonica TaxID=39947 RepID=C7J321_ORYSJ|nr:Os05g0355133 [Oryza sativa Japonica Group]|eukprot:NP_001174377.1 Os05g0355133 [Oryza sativa Japonica Group]
MSDDQLPKYIDGRIVDYCIRKRLPWTSCFARKICKEGEYYEELMRYLRRNLAVCCSNFSQLIRTSIQK